MSDTSKIITVLRIRVFFRILTGHFFLIPDPESPDTDP